MPAVSVVIPTYNRAPLLREAVASVLNQTYQDWELIVADDGSTDETRDYLAGVRDPRVRPLFLDHTGNAARARNAGVASARGSWIAFLDSDDVWLPEKLTLQLRAHADRPACRWSCTCLGFIDANGGPASQRSGPPYYPHSGWILELLLTFTAAAATQTMIVAKTLFDEIGGFDPALVPREDYDLALRLAARNEIHTLPETLTLVRQHSGRTTSLSRVADLYRCNELVFRKAGAAATSKSIRDICRRQRATQLVSRARVLARDGQQRDAFVSLAQAIIAAPFEREVQRAAIKGAMRVVGWRAATD